LHNALAATQTRADRAYRRDHAQNMIAVPVKTASREYRQDRHRGRRSDLGDFKPATAPATSAISNRQSRRQPRRFQSSSVQLIRPFSGVRSRGVARRKFR
jgi:hypothetical protein